MRRVQRLRIGLNLIFLTPGEQGGMEVYARELIAQLAARDEFDLIAFVGRGARDEHWGDGVRSVLVDVDARDRKQWVLGEQLKLPRLAARAGCALVHSMASTAPLYGRFRRITTIHDLNYKLVPEAHFGLAGLGMRILLPAAARTAQRVITDSSSTADDLVRHLGIARDKIDAIPLGVTQRPVVRATAADELRARLKLDDRPVVLSFSAKRPHKNLARLIEAHAALPTPRPLLVLPGYQTVYELQLRTLAAQLATSDDVRFLGWVSDADREGLYALATVFAFPSLYEGFGLPPLEAMARGVPVLTSTRGSLAEVIGEAKLPEVKPPDGSGSKDRVLSTEAAVTVDPESVPEITTGLMRLLNDAALRERLIAAGRVQATKFTWERTADLTAASYRRALATP